MKKWSLLLVVVCLLSIISLTGKVTSSTIAVDEGAGPALVKKI